MTRVKGASLSEETLRESKTTFGRISLRAKGGVMKKLVVMLAAVSAIAAMIGASDASAQSWGRRGANVRCTNGGVVQGRWYCNLKHAPPGEWNSYRSTGRYKSRPSMQGR